MAIKVSSTKVKQDAVEACTWVQERIKGLRELIPHIGPILIVIPLKIFLDLL